MDVTAAKEIAIGVDVLLEGSDGYAKEGYNFIWTTNVSKLLVIFEPTSAIKISDTTSGVEVKLDV